MSLYANEKVVRLTLEEARARAIAGWAESARYEGPKGDAGYYWSNIRLAKEGKMDDLIMEIYGRKCVKKTDPRYLDHEVIASGPIR